MHRVPLVLGAIAAAMAGLGYAYLAGPCGLIDAKELSDGTELRLILRPSEDLFYCVDLFVRPPGGKWGACYIGHEELRWPRGKLRIESGNVVQILDGGELRAVYDHPRKILTLVGHAYPERGVPEYDLEPSD